MEFLWLCSVLMMARHVVCSVRADVAILKQPFIPAAQCPNLKCPANCAVMITGNLPGDTATYLCEENFALVETRTLICNENGLWIDIPTMRRSVDGMFIVGFVETTYTVIEGDGQVEVCVNLTSPEGDMGDERVLVEVFTNTDPGSIPADAAAATADTVNLGGFHGMVAGTDYPQLIIDFNPIMNMVITGTNRVICYNQTIYDDDRVEEDEFFSLTLTVQNGSALITVVDPQLSSAVIKIVDDESLCPGLENPANGAVMVNGKSPENNANYFCDTGFELEGADTLICGYDRLWHPDPPVCRPLCPNLENPANGAVMMNGVSPEDTANYSCDTGFDLVGAATLTCRDGGMWSPDPPVCRRMIKFTVTSYTFIENEGIGMVTVMGPVDFPGTLSIHIIGGPGAQPSTVRTSGTSVNEELTSFPANISFPIIDDEVALETVERYSLSLIPSDPSITINQFMSEIVILDDDDIIIVGFPYEEVTFEASAVGNVKIIAFGEALQSFVVNYIQDFGGVTILTYDAGNYSIGFEKQLPLTFPIVSGPQNYFTKVALDPITESVTAGGLVHILDEHQQLFPAANITIIDIDQEKESTSPALITIVTPVGMSALIAIIIAIATVTIRLWKRRKQGEDGSHDSPDHIYDVPDYITNIVSQHRLESQTRQNEIAMNINPTSHAVLSPNEMKSNIAYGCSVSGQQRSTDITPGGVEYSDMQPNIAYGSIASDQQRSTNVPLNEVEYSDIQSNIAYGCNASSQQSSTDVAPGGVEYSDMQPNIAYGCGASGQQRSTDVTPGGVEYSDMQSNIAYGCVVSD